MSVIGEFSRRLIIRHKEILFQPKHGVFLLRHLPGLSCNVSKFSTTKYTEAPARESNEEITNFEVYERRFKDTHFNFKHQGQATKIDVDKSENSEEKYIMPHPCWSEDESNAVEIHHRKPQAFVDYLAYGTIMCMRYGFDFFSGYLIKSYLKTIDERDMLRRCIFLETVAAVPGFSAGLIRHLKSLRRMERDHGWIHTLLEEAENERMHLLTFIKLRSPGPIFRGAVMVAQTVFTIGFTTAYIISPRFCHRLVGYLEEQAVVTYSAILDEMDSGNLPMWSNLPAPEIAISYWKLRPDASMRDVILVIRADEAHHRLVNHTLGSLNQRTAKNPFKAGE